MISGTQFVIVTNQTGSWVVHEHGTVSLHNDDGEACGYLKRERLARHVAILRQLTPDQNELLQPGVML